MSFGSGAFGSTPFGAIAADSVVMGVLTESISIASANEGLATVVLTGAISMSEIQEAIAVSVLFDRVVHTGGAYPVVTANESLSEEVLFEEALVVVWRMLAAEQIDLLGAAVGKRNTLGAIVDTLHASGLVASRMDAVVSLSTALAINSLIASGWKAEAAENVVFQDTLTATLRAIVSLLDTVQTTDAVSPSLRLTAVVEEGFAITPSPSAMNELFASLREHVLLYTSIRLGADDYVGWVLNEGAPSEYRNFPMNGLAEAFNGRYFGTSNEGLFELVGDDDDGEDIEASFKTMLMDFGTATLKSLPEAYVALSTDGTQLVFRVISVDARGVQTENIYTSPVTAGGMHNEQLPVGRGLKAVYWQFELQNVNGADFDIDHLSFRPLILDRRI